MARSSTQRKKPAQKKITFVERALDGMTRRLEKGETLGDLEVPLFLMMLHAFNSREMTNYTEMFNAVQDRVAKVEAHLRSQVNLRQAVEGGRRVPQPNLGPPNQDPFAQRNT